MSPLELVDDRFEQVARELRTARPVPSERLRKRVAVLTQGERDRGNESTVRSRILWGRSTKRIALALAVLVIAVPLVGAGVQGLHDTLSSKPAPQVAGRNPSPRPESLQHGSSSAQALRSTFEGDKAAIAPNPGRLQQYDATLRLRVRNVEALSNATKRAMNVTRALGGYVAAVGYSTRGGRRGGATLVLRVPVPNVQIAVERFSALGTILGQRVSILDVQRRAGRQSRQIQSLERDLDRVQRLLVSATGTERSRLLQEAQADRLALKTLRRQHRALLRRAHLAKVTLSLTTPAKHAAAGGRLQDTLDDAGSVLVREFQILLYALLVIGPLLAIGGAALALARVHRRRSDRRLLERA